MHKPIADRKEFYQMLTSGILCWRFHQAYSDKISAHIGELVLKHTQNIDTFLKEKLGNIRHLARQLPITEPEMAQQFLTSQLAELNDEYGDALRDMWKAEVLTLIIFLLGCAAIVSVSFTLLIEIKSVTALFRKWAAPLKWKARWERAPVS